MIVEELQAAAELTGATLERYLNACTSFADYCATENKPFGGFSQPPANNIATQLRLIDSYHAKLTKARHVIGRSGNRNPAIVPITRLPTDVLIYIFELFISSRPCYLPAEKSKSPIGAAESPYYSSNYPELLLQICSDWRRLALATPSLWCHIDLSPQPHLCWNLTFRACRFMVRAKKSLLDVHIAFGEWDGPEKASLNTFCAILAPRMRSLEFSTNKDFRSVPACATALRICLLHGIPGTLSQLTLSSGRLELLEGIVNASDPLDHTLDLPQLEAILSKVETLRLYKVYPFWTNSAYHGLVELHLHCARFNNTVTSINESLLVGILASSPKLRILHFGLRIEDPSPVGASPTPVQLCCLEVLDLTCMHYDQYEDFIRLIAPGSSPLHISLVFAQDIGQSFLGTQFTRFYARSHITRMDLTGCSILLNNLLAHLPHLQVLSLFGFKIELASELPSLSWDMYTWLSRASRYPKVHTMHLRYCTFEIGALHCAVQTYCVHAVTIEMCWLRWPSIGRIPCRKEIFGDIVRLVPIVRFSADAPRYRS